MDPPRKKMVCVMGEHFKNFTRYDRIRLETLYSAGHKPAECAAILGFHVSSIYRELKKGMYTHTLSDYTEEERYSCDLAQSKADKGHEKQGPGLKIGNNIEFANRIEELIIENGYSPAAALAQAKKEGPGVDISLSTLYSYIEKGVFEKLTFKELPGKHKKKKSKRRKVAKRVSKGKSIEERPKEADDREVFGHWEMDTVVGKQGDSKKSLLVLTERKTREEIIRKLPAHTTEEVVKALDRIERHFGSRMFRKIFRSITVDNGSEFQDFKGMERSKRNKKNRTEVYYCHPYCSSERGSNENQNRLIRRHIPKGINFDDKSLKDISEIESWMNTYPRKIFGYRTSQELFDEELARIA